MPDSLSPTDLAMLDALGETTSEERAALLAACERDPQLAAEFRRLTGEVRLLDAALAPAPPMPERALRQLDAERRATLAKLRSERGAGLTNVVQIPSSTAERAALEKAGAAARTPRNTMQRWGGRLAIAAALVVFAGFGVQWFTKPAARPSAVALSPSAETGVTTPALVWENAPGQLYNVWVLPPDGPVETVPALFKADNVTSPVAFAELKTKGSATALEEGQDYRLLICRAGTQRLGGVAVPFHVAKNASATIPKPQDAQVALGEMRRLAAEGKPGDALGLFTTLPQSIRDNPKVAEFEKDLREQVRASRQ